MTTAFSTILEMKCRFEMGQMFFRISGSSKIFLISGVRIASLKLSGNVSMDKDKLTKSVKTDKSVSGHCLRSHVGKGSRLYDLDSESLMIFLTVFSDSGGNSDRVNLQDAVEAGNWEG